MDKRVTIDAAAAEALKGAEPGVELVGPDGQLVGGFVPAKILRDLKWMLEDRQRRYGEGFDQLTPDEIERRVADARANGIPIDRLMKELGLE